jgi:hypothetical protein
MGKKRKYQPQQIKDADTIYTDKSALKLNAFAKIIGGAINPASIANACCKPQDIDTSSGKSECNP